MNKHDTSLATHSQFLVSSYVWSQQKQHGQGLATGRCLGRSLGLFSSASSESFASPCWTEFILGNVSRGTFLVANRGHAKRFFMVYAKAEVCSRGVVSLRCVVLRCVALEIGR